jgi:hypothetical protein
MYRRGWLSLLLETFGRGVDLVLLSNPLEEHGDIFCHSGSHDHGSDGFGDFASNG